MTREQHNAQMRGGLEFFLRLPLLIQAVIMLIAGGGITGGSAALINVLTIGQRLYAVEQRADELLANDSTRHVEVRSLARDISVLRAEQRVQSDYLACLNDPGVAENVREFCRAIRDQVHRNLDLLRR